MNTNYQIDTRANIILKEESTQIKDLVFSKILQLAYQRSKDLIKRRRELKVKLKILIVLQMIISILFNSNQSNILRVLISLNWSQKSN